MRANTPLVSIIIPAFNRANLIGHSIESIINQTYLNWELIVVDDGSTDETEKVVLNYCIKDNRIKYLKRPTSLPKGANTCRNLGFDKAKGELIKWVDSDDLLDKIILQEQINVFNNHPEIDIVVCNGVYFTEEGILHNEYWSKYVITENLFYDYIRNTVRWHVCGCLWKKNFFKTAPYKLGLMNAQEWLMHATAILRQPIVKGIDTTLFYVRRSPTGRISTNRNKQYFLNAAKARSLLLLENVKSSDRSIKASLEITKQILVNTFHAVKNF